MANETFSEEIQLVGIDTVIQQLQKMGLFGAEAFEKIGTSVQKSNTQLQSFARSMEATSNAFNAFTSRGNAFVQSIANGYANLRTFEQSVISVGRNLFYMGTAIAGTVTGLGYLGAKLVSTADDIRDVAGALNIGASALQKFQLAGAQVGIGADRLNGLLARLGKQYDEAADAQRRLGGSNEQLLNSFVKSGGTIIQQVDGVWQRLGATYEQTQKRLEDLGVRELNVTKRLKTTNEIVNGSKNIFELLNVSLVDAKGNSVNYETALLRLGKTLASYSGEQRKAAIAQALSVRDFRAAEFLTNLAEQYQKADETLKKYKLSLDDVDKANSEAANGIDVLASIFQSARAKIGEAISPISRLITDGLIDLIGTGWQEVARIVRENTNLINLYIIDFFNVLKGNDEAVSPFGQSMIKWRDNIIAFGKSIVTVAGIVVNFVSLIISGLDKVAVIINKVFGTNLTGTDLAIIAVLAKLTGTIGLVVAGFRLLGSVVVIAFRGLGTLAAAIGTVASALKTAWEVSKIFLGTFARSALVAIVALFTSIPGLIVAAIVAAGALIYVFWDEIVAAAKFAWGLIKTAFSTGWDFIKELFTSGAAAIQFIWNNFGTIINSIWEGIKTAAKGAWDFLVTSAGAVWEGIKTAFTTGWEFLKTGWEGFKTATSGVWNFLTETASAAWAKIREFASTTWDAIVKGANENGKLIGSALSGVYDFVTAPLRAIGNFISKSIDGIIETSKKLLDGVRGALDAVATVSKATELTEKLIEPFRLASVQIAQLWLSLEQSLNETSTRIAESFASKITSSVVEAINKARELLNNDSILRPVTDTAGPTTVGESGPQNALAANAGINNLTTANNLLSQSILSVKASIVAFNNCISLMARNTIVQEDNVNLFNSALQSLGTTLSGTSSALTGAANALQGSFDSAAAGIQNVLNGIANAVNSVMSSLQSQVQSVGASVDAMISTIIAKLEQAAAAAQALASIAANAGGSSGEFSSGAGFAGGGGIRGAGSATGDGIPIWASANEWIIKARSARYYGDRIMAMINSGIIPRENILASIRGFAGGGNISFPDMNLSSLISPIIQPQLRFAEINRSNGGGPGGLHPVNLYLPGGETIQGMFAPPDVIEELGRHAKRTQSVSLQKLPGSYGRR